MIAKVNGKLLSLLLKMILNLSNLTEEMEKRLSDQLRYLTISAIDEEWGIVVTTVGYQFIPPKGNYPLSKHPDNYNFKPQTGRILNEYQLVASFTDAWIETEWVQRIISWIIVASFTDAWIETHP